MIWIGAIFYNRQEFPPYYPVPKRTKAPSFYVENPTVKQQNGSVMRRKLGEFLSFTSRTDYSNNEKLVISWWRQNMETLSALLQICARNPPDPQLNLRWVYLKLSTILTTSEWVIKFTGLFEARTADIEVHVIHTRRIIITYYVVIRDAYSTIFLQKSFFNRGLE